MQRQWTFCPHWAEAFGTSDKPALIQQIEAGQGSLIKRGRHRVVMRTRLAGLCCYVKVHRPARLSGQLWQLVAGSRASREWRTAIRLRQVGVNAPRPLAVGQRRWRLGEPSYYVCEEITGACTLAETWSRSTHSEKLLLLAQTGRAVARIHRAGINCPDLHPGNILVRDGTVFFIDFHSSRPLPVLSRKRRVRSLAGLAIGLGEPASETTSRLIEAYGQAFGDDWKALSRGIEKTSRKLRFERIATKHRRAVRRSLQETSNGRRLYLGTDVAASTAHRWLDDPGKAPIKSNARKAVYRLETPERRLVLYRYRDRGWIKSVRFLIGNTRSERAWHSAFGLLARGIGVPTPLFCLSRRSGDDWVGFDWLLGITQMDDFVLQGGGVGAGRRRELIQALGSLLHAFYRSGVRHPDLAPKNIQLRSSPGASCLVTDLDGIRFLRGRVRARSVRRNLVQLNDLSLRYISPRDRLRLLVACKSWLPTADLPAWARAIQKGTRARARRRQRRWLDHRSDDNRRYFELA